ncbi:hypothetical protein BVX93_00725 [bacterium B13(2017)]|nr:hypothetical protein BVX93_00725 [bacterium B13(2017)]
MKENNDTWIFDEFKQVGVDYNNHDIASDYDSQHNKFRNFNEEAMKIFNTLNLSQDSIILDIGCGTGGLTTHLAKMCKHIYAVDVSNTMLDILRKKVSDQKLENVSIEHNGFLKYEHNEEKFDAIVANITLHHLPDFWKQIALCRLNDMLKQEGKLFIADVVFGFNPRMYETSIETWLEGMEVNAGKQMAEETKVHVRDEYSTWTWIMTGMLERAGFKIENDSEFMSNIRAYICTKQSIVS